MFLLGARVTSRHGCPPQLSISHLKNDKQQRNNATTSVATVFRASTVFHWARRCSRFNCFTLRQVSKNNVSVTSVNDECSGFQSVHATTQQRQVSRRCFVLLRYSTGLDGVHVSTVSRFDKCRKNIVSVTSVNDECRATSVGTSVRASTVYTQQRNNDKCHDGVSCFYGIPLGSTVFAFQLCFTLRQVSEKHC